MAGADLGSGECGLQGRFRANYIDLEGVCRPWVVDGDGGLVSSWTLLRPNAYPLVQGVRKPARPWDLF